MASMLTLAGAIAVMVPSASAAAATGCTTGTKSCRVDIGVSGTSGSYAVKFTPDVLHVKQNQLGKQYKITFRIRTKGFVFQGSDGIEFKDPTGDEFTCSKVTTSKKQWKCTYKNQVLGKYRYKATFHDTAGNEVVGDPLITNIDTN
jgi:hypothetical protein